MPRDVRRYPDDDYSSPDRRSQRSKSKDRKLGIGLKIVNFFKPQSRRVVVVEDPVRRRQRPYTERSVSQERSLSPQRGRANMSPRIPGDDFVPLPPKIPKEPRPAPRDNRPDRDWRPDPGYDVRVVAPGGYRNSDDRPLRPFEEPRPEIIEVRPVAAAAKETERERAKRKKAERQLERERKARQAAQVVADRNYDIAEDYRDRLDKIADGVHRINLNHQKTQQELAQERWDRVITQRERDVLERDRQLEAEERSRQLGGYGPPIPHGPRPVDLFQEPRPVDPGTDAIRQAQRDRQRMQENRGDDHLLYRNQRERNADAGRRRGSVTTYDDQDARRGHRNR